MNFNDNLESSVHRRGIQYAKELAIILLVVLFYFAYRFITPMNMLLDKAINPAVAGLTLAYGKISTVFYGLSGINAGFVSIPPDSEFLFSVQLATYINERQAAPLLRIASDIRMPREKRERALRALLKFESASEWIQPFLNELPKGGLLGIYEEESTVLDELAKKISEEGGVTQELVQAYAEAVFGFMLQVPDAIVRRHALRWVTDVLPDDAVYLIASRLEREEDPKVREAVEQSLFRLKAVSDPTEAVSQLLPHYQKPKWPTARTAVASVLARLGHESSVDYIHFVLKSQAVSEDQRVVLRVAADKTPYPSYVKARASKQSEWAQLSERRDAQRRQSWSKHQAAIQRERSAQKVQLVKNTVENVGNKVEFPETVDDSRKQIDTKSEKEDSLANAKPLVSEDSHKGMQVRKEPQEYTDQVPQKTAPRTQSSVKSTPFASEGKTKNLQEKSPPKPFLPPELVESDQQVTLNKSEMTTPPTETEKIPSKEQYASLPDALKMPEEYFPPEEEMAKPPKSLMNFVDAVFEVTNEKTQIYQDPGSNKSTGVTLVKGNKGKAELEMMIGEEKWYQVKTKQGNGWVKAEGLSVFNLSPAEAVAPTVQQTSNQTISQAPLEGAREEQTYFEAATPEVPIFAKPGESEKRIGMLTEEIAYLAEKSERKQGERWFLLQIRSGEKAWVRGTDIRLANVQQPAQMKIPTKPMSLRDQKSAFFAEWIVASVKGVGVYSRPSISGVVLKQINPPDVYKVVELSSGGGKEWYRIQLPGKKDGWVQAMDVNLTKPK